MDSDVAGCVSANGRSSSADHRHTAPTTKTAPVSAERSTDWNPTIPALPPPSSSVTPVPEEGGVSSTDDDDGPPKLSQSAESTEESTSAGCAAPESSDEGETSDWEVDDDEGPEEYLVLDDCCWGVRDDDPDEYYPDTSVFSAAAAPTGCALDNNSRASDNKRWDDGIEQMEYHLEASGYSADGKEAMNKIRMSFPRQKLRKTPFQHRPRLQRDTLFNSLVARPVHKKEINSVKSAFDAMTTERKKLDNRKVWDVNRVEGWCNVQRRGRDTGVKTIMGRVFGICVK